VNLRSEMTFRFGSKLESIAACMWAVDSELPLSFDGEAIVLTIHDGERMRLLSYVESICARMEMMEDTLDSLPS
jgi:hypothetical protein